MKKNLANLISVAEFRRSGYSERLYIGTLRRGVCLKSILSKITLASALFSFVVSSQCLAHGGPLVLEGNSAVAWSHWILFDLSKEKNTDPVIFATTVDSSANDSGELPSTEDHNEKKLPNDPQTFSNDPLITKPSVAYFGLRGFPKTEPVMAENLTVSNDSEKDPLVTSTPQSFFAFRSFPGSPEKSAFNLAAGSQTTSFESQYSDQLNESYPIAAQTEPEDVHLGLWMLLDKSTSGNELNPTIAMEESSLQAYQEDDSSYPIAMADNPHGTVSWDNQSQGYFHNGVRDYYSASPNWESIESRDQPFVEFDQPNSGVVSDSYIAQYSYPVEEDQDENNSEEESIPELNIEAVVAVEQPISNTFETSSVAEVSPFETAPQMESVLSPYPHLVAMGQAPRTVAIEECPKVQNSTSYPCRSKRVQSCRGYVSADFLYWRAYEGGLVCGCGASEIDDTRIIDENGNEKIISKMKGHDRDLDYRWDPGYRVGIGYQFDCSRWDLGATWTHFHSSSKEDGDDNNTRNWKVLFEQADLILGRTFSFGSCFDFRPFGGIRAVWLNQHYKTHKATFITSSIGNDLFVVDAKDKQKFNGFGPLIGVEFDWPMACGFSFYGSADAALLYGNYYVKSAALELFEFNESLCNKRRSLNANQVVLDLEFGLRWSHCFCRRFRLIFDCALEHHRFFDHNHFNECGDLCLEGVTFSTTIEF